MLRREYALLHALTQREPAAYVPQVYRLNKMLPDAPPMVLMEYIEGIPLSEWGLHHTLTLTEVERMATQLVACLTWLAERGVLHNDLHPGNVMVRPDGSVVLLDFGLAERLSPHSGTAMTHRMGVSAYVAPERLSHERVSVQADLYSVGTLLDDLHCTLQETPALWENPPHVLLFFGWGQVIDAMRAEHPMLRADLACVQAAVARLRSLRRRPPHTPYGWWREWTLPWHLWRVQSIIRQGRQKGRELSYDLNSLFSSLFQFLVP